MTKTEKLLKKCYKFMDNESAEEVGVFLSVLSARYLLVFNATKKQFLKSLSNSIDIVNKELENDNSNNN